jgi:hypothetical protein
LVKDKKYRKEGLKEDAQKKGSRKQRNIEIRKASNVRKMGQVV